MISAPISHFGAAATIRFRRPGRGLVRAQFRIPQERSDAIVEALRGAEKVEPQFEVDIIDESGQTVAAVEKVLSIRKRK